MTPNNQRSSSSSAAGCMSNGIPSEVIGKYYGIGSSGSSTATTHDGGLTVSIDGSGMDSEFELMKVKVTVLGLAGVISETIEPKKKNRDHHRSTPRTTPNKIKFGNKKHQQQQQQQHRGGGGGVSSSTTVSSLSTFPPEELYYNNVEEDLSGNDDTAATFAVINFHRNVQNSTNTTTTIATHVPSLPMGKPVSSIESLNRYIAHWPVEDQPFLPRKGEIDRSSYMFDRLMMREPPQQNMSTPDGPKTMSSNFSSETIDLHISLSRGKELIKIGIASLTITGNEEGAELMNIPAKAITYRNKGKNMVLGSPTATKKRRLKLFKQKRKNRSSFSSDPTRIFRLDENASLRVMVKVLPNYAVEAIEAADDRQDSSLLGRNAETLINNDANEDNLTRAEGAKAVSTPKGFHESVGIFCGGGFFNDDSENNDYNNTPKVSNSCAQNEGIKKYSTPHHQAFVDNVHYNGLPILNENHQRPPPVDPRINVHGPGASLALRTSTGISSVSESTASSSCDSFIEDQTDKDIYIIRNNAIHSEQDLLSATKELSLQARQRHGVQLR